MSFAYRGIRPGDTVTYMTPQGQLRRGRAVRMLIFARHVTVDAGGGRPAVVDDRNYVNHRARGGKA